MSCRALAVLLSKELCRHQKEEQFFFLADKMVAKTCRSIHRSKNNQIKRQRQFIDTAYCEQYQDFRDSNNNNALKDRYAPLAYFFLCQKLVEYFYKEINYRSSEKQKIRF